MTGAWSGTSQTPGARLRELVGRGLVVMPGAFNAFSALLIERCGFEAVYVSGAGVSACRGMPDVGLLTMTEMAEEAGHIAQAVRIPTVADADTGYGESPQVRRTVQEFESFGLAGLQIEDQDAPKRCGHLAGKKLIGTAAMCQKIAAAVEARRDPNFFIVARTDSRAVEGVEGAIRRAHAYVEAGADAIFPEALESVEEFQIFAKAVGGPRVPLVANMTEWGKTPYLSAAQFADLGYRIVLFPMTAFRVTAKAMEQALQELKATGTQQGLLGQMQSRAELYELLRYADYEQRDQQLAARYGDQSGG